MREINKEKLKQLYLVRKLPISEIAKEFGCSVAIISNRIKKLSEEKPEIKISPEENISLKVSTTLPREFSICIDTREQDPLFKETNDYVEYKKYRFNIKKKALRTGDYSIEGLENIIVIERKRKDEIFGNLGADRERLIREMERMQTIRFPIMVLETSLADIMKGSDVSLVHPNNVVSTLISFMFKYRTQILFADNKEAAKMMTFYLLAKFYTYLREGKLPHDN